MSLDTVATSGIDSVLNGQGSVVTVMGLFTLGLVFICWFFIKDASARNIALQTQNNDLTNKLIDILEDNGRILTTLTETIRNGQK